jgi:hypothetical protein
MSCIDCPTIIEQYGADPKTIQWNVVRGDTASIRIEFLEDDEVTYVDTSGWTYLATAFNLLSNESISLNVVVSEGYVDITATPEQTDEWGVGYSTVVAELPFDLQITTNETIWTPVIGTIRVLSDVTPGGSL